MRNFLLPAFCSPRSLRARWAVDFEWTHRVGPTSGGAHSNQRFTALAVSKTRWAKDFSPKISAPNHNVRNLCTATCLRISDGGARDEKRSVGIKLIFNVLIQIFSLWLHADMENKRTREHGVIFGSVTWDQAGQWALSRRIQAGTFLLDAHASGFHVSPKYRRISTSPLFYFPQLLSAPDQKWL